MSDIIKLLPDAVANQIAAGEVIQRPASAVKELLENAIDAGSTDIKLIVKDAGRTLIQVIDNGCGMSETDARMCFERHATSKITNADDLFKILTMGFRGEAMASIASVAQVELRTRRHDDPMGTLLVIEGFEFKYQEPVSTPPGTNIQIKNLFFNVPARRNFLKSDPVEIKHIIEEFLRVALANPQIALSMFSNGNEVYKLPSGTLINRLTAIFGNKYNEKVVKIEESTDIVTMQGYIGKPEHARKTRGEQYMFVNKRFIRSPFLQHAVQTAYNELITKESFPSYFIYFDIDPTRIDINIHPTKTEIKFDDEKAIYAYLRAAVKNSLGKFSLTPSMDFEQEMGFNIPHRRKDEEVKMPTITVNPNYNPFDKENQRDYQLKERVNKQNWETLYPSRHADNQLELQNLEPKADEPEQREVEMPMRTLMQLHKTYIISAIKSGLMLVHQQYAHERVLYEHFLEKLDKRDAVMQQSLFPQQIELPAADAEVLRHLTEELKYLGFDVSDMGGNAFAFYGYPAEFSPGKLKETVETLINTYNHNEQDLKLDFKDNLARSLARSMAIKPGKILGQNEMQGLIDSLFGCSIPYLSPTGKETIITITADELEKRFSQQK